jgi:hypothetical protein
MLFCLYTTFSLNLLSLEILNGHQINHFLLNALAMEEAEEEDMEEEEEKCLSLSSLLTRSRMVITISPRMMRLSSMP